MDIKTMNAEQLIERRAAIAKEIEAPNANLDDLENEVKAINAELELRKAEAEKREAIRASVASGAGVVVEKLPADEGKKTPTNEEIRNSPKYVDAFANYIKTGDDKECRALLTENATNGTVPVPGFVDEIIHTAWENDELLSRVRRVFVRGNYKVPFELSATEAEVHTEGTSAISEESYSIGIVTLLPQNIKKWITVSDEAVAMGGERFVRFVYDELTYQVVRKLAKLIVQAIAGASTSSSSTAVGVAKITAAPSVTLVPTAVANLSDEARDPVIILNRLSEVNLLGAQASGNFAIDPFAGLDRVYTSGLPAYDTASTNDVYMIVGDLSGVTVNYPEGDGVTIKYDDLTLSEQDLVKITARQYAGYGLTAPGKMCNIAKPAAAT